MEAGESDLLRLQSLIVQLERQKRSSAISDSDSQPLTPKDENTDVERAQQSPSIVEAKKAIEDDCVFSEIPEPQENEEDVLNPEVTGNDYEWLVDCASNGVEGDNLSKGRAENWFRSEFDSYRGGYSRHQRNQLLAKLTEYSTMTMSRLSPVKTSTGTTAVEDIMAMAREQEIHLKEGTSSWRAMTTLVAPKTLSTSLKQLPRPTADPYSYLNDYNKKHPQAPAFSNNVNSLGSSISDQSLVTKLTNSSHPMGVKVQHPIKSSGLPQPSLTVPNTLSFKQPSANNNNCSTIPMATSIPNCLPVLSSSGSTSHLPLLASGSSGQQTPMTRSAESQLLSGTSTINRNNNNLASNIGRPSGSMSHLPQPRTRLPVSRLVRPSVVVKTNEV